MTSERPDPVSADRLAGAGAVTAGPGAPRLPHPVLHAVELVLWSLLPPVLVLLPAWLAVQADWDRPGDTGWDGFGRAIVAGLVAGCFGVVLTLVAGYLLRRAHRLRLCWAPLALALAALSVALVWRQGLLPGELAGVGLAGLLLATAVAAPAGTRRVTRCVVVALAVALVGWSFAAAEGRRQQVQSASTQHYRALASRFWIPAGDHAGVDVTYPFREDREFYRARRGEVVTGFLNVLQPGASCDLWQRPDGAPASPPRVVANNPIGPTVEVHTGGERVTVECQGLEKAQVLEVARTLRPVGPEWFAGER